MTITTGAGAGEKATPAGATATPDFFQPGYTYQRGHWQFQCLAVAPAPHHGETRAVGFLSRDDGTSTTTALDADDWALKGWTDITTTGEDGTR